MNKILCFFGCWMAWALLLSCDSSDSGKEIQERGQGHVAVQARGGKYYGGTLNLNEKEDIRNLYPPAHSNIHSTRVAGAMMESLFHYDHKKKKLSNILIDGYSLDSSGTVYRLYLKKEVYFHDSKYFPKGKGRKLTANDVHYCLKRLCRNERENLNAFLLIEDIKGAKDFYNKKTRVSDPNGEVEGLKVLDRLTLEITLRAPEPDFLKKLAHPAAAIYAPEAISEENELFVPIGTGPFRIRDEIPGLILRLRKNTRYHRKDELNNPLPFLDGINIRFMKDQASILEEFKLKTLDLCYSLPIPHEGLLPNKIKQPYQREPVPTQESLYLKSGMAGVLSHKEVRAVLYRGINTDSIAKELSLRVANKYKWLIPPLFSELGQVIRDSSNVQHVLDEGSLSQQSREALMALREGTLTLYTLDAPKYSTIAEKLKEQWENTSVGNVDIRPLAYEMLIRKDISKEQAMMLFNRDVFYHSPIDYIVGIKEKQGILGYTRFPNDNSTRSITLEKAKSEKDSITSSGRHLFFYKSLIALEEEFITKALWHEKGYWLRQFYIRGLEMDAIPCPDYAKIYLLKAKKLYN